VIDCEFDTLILSLVLIWIFYVFNFNLQLSRKMKYKKRTFIIACRTNTVMTYLKVFVKRRQYYGNI